MKVYEALAKAFVEEGVDTMFTLMGDANMHWSIAMAEAGVRVVHARHENAALAMADGYARAGRRVGVASVTSGPGTSQIATSLTAAARARVPMVVFAGSTPLAASYHLQQFDIAPFVASTGAKLVEMRDIDNALEAVQRAFVLAADQRLPVVFTAPYDLQDAEYAWDWFYRPSKEMLVAPQRRHPDPEIIARAAAMVSESQRVVILAGQGAVASGAREAILELAERAGAILTTSLKAKGMFEGEPFDAGISGSFSSTAARGFFAEADLVISIGAGMGHFTTEGGYLFPSARVIQIDIEPRPIHEGVPGADLHIIGDAAVTARELASLLEADGPPRGHWRTPDTRQALASATVTEPPVDLAEGTVDPRAAMRAIDAAIPKEWIVVVGAGHMWNFAVEYLTGRSPESYIFTIDFGPVGQGIGVAIGAALARPDTGVALIEGDGGLLMHVQEIETIKRHGIPVVMFVLNDGAFGAEVHKLVARGVDPSEAIFGAPDLAAVSRAFGVPADHVGAETADVEGVLSMGVKSGEAHLFDVHISPNIPSAQFRRLHFGESP